MCVCMCVGMYTKEESEGMSSPDRLFASIEKADLRLAQLCKSVLGKG